jgi:hypothetical protein
LSRRRHEAMGPTRKELDLGDVRAMESHEALKDYLKREIEAQRHNLRSGFVRVWRGLRKNSDFVVTRVDPMRCGEGREAMECQFLRTA